MRAWNLWSVVLLWLFVAESKLVEDLSVSKPFDKISADGLRMLPNYDIGGNTIVQRHFARLTPDRQNKHGYIWLNKNLKMREFSIIFSFRISGQGAKWFGDGLALWVTTSPHHISGDNHGFTDHYTGFGILFDTFVNLEHAGGHRDVTLLENDGTKTLDELNYENKMGCDAPGLRYHEKNAAFSPAVNMSRAKVQLKNNFVQILLDVNNNGEWTDCYQRELKLPAHWLDSATIGVTASTGSLADNHDVIGINVYDSINDEWHGKHDATVKAIKPKDLSQDLNATEYAKISELEKKFSLMQENFEHQLTALKESTENTIQKLRKQEEADFDRIEELERLVSGKVSEKMKHSMGKFNAKVEEKLDQKVAESEAKSGGWKFPFFLLIAGICCAGGFMYKKYQDLRKSHLL